MLAPGALAPLWELPFYPKRDWAVLKTELKEARVTSAVCLAKSTLLVEQSKAAIDASRAIIGKVTSI